MRLHRKGSDGVLERDCQKFRLLLEAAVLGLAVVDRLLHQVRTELAVRGADRAVVFGIHTQRAGELEELHCGLQLDMRRIHVLEQGDALDLGCFGCRGLTLLALDLGLRCFVFLGLVAPLDVGTKATCAHIDRQAFVQADGLVLLFAGFDPLQGGFYADFVGRNAIGDSTASFAVLDIGAKLADAHHDRFAGVHANGNGANRARIDAFGALRDDAFQARCVARPEALEERGARQLTFGDLVKFGFHVAREAVVDQLRFQRFERLHDGKSQRLRHECLVAQHRIAARRDRLERGAVGGRATDAELLHLGHERGFGVARRRRGLVAFRNGIHDARCIARAERRQLLLAIIECGFCVVSAFDIDTTEAGKVRDAATRQGDDGTLGRCGRKSRHDRGVALFSHLAGDRALPDHLVDARFQRALA